jgi:predicted MPP superfamily phosphohydrolase
MGEGSLSLLGIAFIEFFTSLSFRSLILHEKILNANRQTPTKDCNTSIDCLYKWSTVALLVSQPDYPANMQAKYDELGKLVDLGNKISETSAYGGFVWQYEKGALYWHTSVAEGRVTAVWGPIYEKYRALGGHDVNNKTGTRMFGFPVSDQKWDRNGLYRVSEFETGAIYDIVMGPQIYRGNAIFGSIYQEWKALGAEKSELGYPIEMADFHGGIAIYFERGCMWKGEILNGKVVTCYLRTPQLGKPKLIDPTKPTDLAFSAMAAFVGLSTEDVKELDALMKYPGMGSFCPNLWRGRLFLRRVIKKGEPEEVIPLKPFDYNLVTDVAGGGHTAAVIADVPASTPPSVTSPTAFGAESPNWQDKESPQPLNLKFVSFGIWNIVQDRGLYEILFQLPGRDPFPIAPNSVYVKNNWSSFGLIHVTDIHANRRSDHFGNKLRRFANDPDVADKAGWMNGVMYHSNWNDAFRDMIKYANDLYDQGRLDLILCTGDIVDYVYENLKYEQISDDGLYSASGANFLFFEKLVLGLNPSQDAEKKTTSERLRVPIFTILGNHDYRPNSYMLYASVKGLYHIEKYKDHALTEHEAKALTLGLDEYKKRVKEREAGATDVLMFKIIGLDEATSMVEYRDAEDSRQYYRAKINREYSYVLKLGRHRIVMLDVKHDIGVPLDTDVGSVLSYLAKSVLNYDEKFNDASSGGPKSKGFDDGQLRLTQDAIAEAKSGDQKGLVIVGMHNGPINIGAHSHLIRMSVHPFIEPKWMEDFLLNLTGVNPLGASMTFRAAQREKAREAGWKFSDTPFFKTGTNAHLLDKGIAHGKSNEFMKLCAGAEFQAGKNADLILYGHHHVEEEFIIKWKDEQMKEIAYYTDFFTYMPSRYYSNTFSKRDGQSVRIILKNGANPKNIKSTHRKGVKDGVEFDIYELETPPYENPLVSQSDKAEWWRIHSPLYLQTAALGPLDTYERKNVPEDDLSNLGLHFSGVKVITVVNNIISTIETVTLPAMREQIGHR